MNGISNIGKVLIKSLFVLLYILSYHIIALGGETEEYCLEDDWGWGWLGGDFSDVECGEVIIHISFSEESRKIFGTCEEPVNVHIESEGTWWTYGGRKRYSDVLPVMYDEKIGYQIRKKLPYGKYIINDFSYMGEVSSVNLINYFDYTFPIVFEISQEEPEIPVFMEIKKKKENSVEGINNYHKIYDEAKEKGIKPMGEASFHTEPGNLESEYFVVVEMYYMRNSEQPEIHYFGKTNNYTYTAELYPGIYQIHRVYYINKEGTVLAEDKAIRNYEFEILPQCDTVEINLGVNGNLEENLVNAEREIQEEISVRKTAETSMEIKTASKKEDGSQNRGLVMVYRLIALMVLAGLVGGGYLLLTNKK